MKRERERKGGEGERESRAAMRQRATRGGWSRHRPRTVSNLAKFRRLKRDTPRHPLLCPFDSRHPSVIHPASPSRSASLSRSIPHHPYRRSARLSPRLVSSSAVHPRLPHPSSVPSAPSPSYRRFTARDRNIRATTTTTTRRQVLVLFFVV